MTGFGCRPYTDLDAGETGPAFESRQGRRAGVWGSRISGLYGDYMSGGNVKLHFWVFHFHPFFCSNLESPFFRPDPGVSRERDAQGLSRTAQ